MYLYLIGGLGISIVFLVVYLHVKSLRAQVADLSSSLKLSDTEKQTTVEKLNDARAKLADQIIQTNHALMTVDSQRDKIKSLEADYDKLSDEELRASLRKLGGVRA